MSVIIIPRKHLRQPQGRLQINWGNPLTRGLAAVCTPDGELVSKTPADAVVGDWARSVNHQGRIARGPGSDGLAYWSFLLAKPAVIAGDFSFFLFGGAASTGKLPAAGTVNTGALGICSVELGATQAGSLLDNNSGPSAAIDGSKGAQVFAVRRGNQVHTIADGINAGSSITGTRTGTITELFFGRSKSLNTAAGTWAAYMALWTRGITDEEARAHHKAPWQLFRADPVRVYSLPSGAISLSINSITASNITQTGARITLGLTR